MSSTTASVKRKSFSGRGTRVPSIARTTTANAMSVAVGMAQPRRSGPALFNTRYSSAGIAMPPNAASTGRLAVRRSRSSPRTSSRLISMPTTKKNTAIGPLFTHSRTVSVTARLPRPIVRLWSHRSAYDAAATFAQINAAAVAASSSAPPSTSTLTKSLPTGDSARPATGMRTCVRRSMSVTIPSRGRRTCSPTRLPGTPAVRLPTSWRA